MENRFVATFAASSLQFNVVQDDAFTSDIVNLVDPDRGLYGFQQTKNFFTHVDNIALSFEDRLKMTPTFALIGGIRIEDITLDRDRLRRRRPQRTADGYPFVEELSAGDRPRRLHLGAAAWPDVLQPVRHGRRSRRRQHLLIRPTRRCY